MAKAVVLLSGGLDSATALAEAKVAGFEPYALTILYGQRHAVERDAARRVAAALGVVRHVEQEIDLRAFGGSALTDAIEVPKDRPHAEIATGHSDHLRPGSQYRIPRAGAGLGRDPGRLRSLHRCQLHRLFRLSRLPAGIPSRLRVTGPTGDQGRRRRDGPVSHPCSLVDADQGADHSPRAGAGGRLRADP